MPITVPKKTEIADFPVELLERVFSYLPERNYSGPGWLIVSQVCRVWRSIALSQHSRPLQMYLRPDRAQKYIQDHFAEVYSPLPLYLVVQEDRLAISSAEERAQVMQFLRIISKRIQELYLVLQLPTSGQKKKRIEELLSVVLPQPTLQNVTFYNATVYSSTPSATHFLELPSIREKSHCLEHIRSLKLYHCQLRPQEELFATLASLKDFGASTLSTPLLSMLSGLPTARLTTLELATTPLPTHNPRSAPKLMPALRSISLKSSMDDVTAFMHGTQMPSLESLTLNFSPELYSDPVIMDSEPLVAWLTSSFGGISDVLDVKMSVEDELLDMNLTGKLLYNGSACKTLKLAFPLLTIRRNLMGPNRMCEGYEGFLSSLMSRTFADTSHTHVYVDFAQTAMANTATTNHYTYVDETIRRYFNMLSRATSLQLNPSAARRLLPLENGAFAQLSELSIAKVGEVHESLHAVAREEAEVRNGTCRVLLDGVDIADWHGSPMDID